MDMVRYAAGRVPVLGVCLGHQAIGVAYGAKVGRAPELLHGKTSLVHHQGLGVLAGLPDPFTATRYHSLAVETSTVPDEIEVTGSTASGVVMAMRHRDVDVEGVQFHPESVLTEGGHRMLANWLVRLRRPAGGPALDRPRPRRRGRAGPRAPLTRHAAASVGLAKAGQGLGEDVPVGLVVGVGVGRRRGLRDRDRHDLALGQQRAGLRVLRDHRAGLDRVRGLRDDRDAEAGVGQVGLGLLLRLADHRRHRHLAAGHGQRHGRALGDRVPSFGSTAITVPAGWSTCPAA